MTTIAMIIGGAILWILCGFAATSLWFFLFGEYETPEERAEFRSKSHFPYFLYVLLWPLTLFFAAFSLIADIMIFCTLMGKKMIDASPAEAFWQRCSDNAVMPKVLNCVRPELEEEPTMEELVIEAEERRDRIRKK